MTSRWRVFFSLAAFVVLFDQVTKWWVVKTLPLDASWPVISGFFNLVSVRNRGAAFGFLNRSDIDWQFWLFSVATLIAVSAIFVLMKKSGRAPLLWSGLGLILGGVIGNFIDRIRAREVIDFLDFYLGSWHWPAFNLADIAICIGAGLTGLAILLGHDKRTS